MKFTRPDAAIASSLLVVVAATAVDGLDNGLIVPPMGWSSWYGFTSNINEGLIRGQGDAMVSSGLHAAGYEHIWIDDGYAIGRENKSGSCLNGPTTNADSCKVIVDPVEFPSGMRNLSDRLHGQGLKFGVYTSKGPLTCLGYGHGPYGGKRPGSYGYEAIDAETYVTDWQVDAVKDDGCGATPDHNPWTTMRDALNKTGKPIWFAIHAGNCNDWTDPVKCVNGSSANMWRTGGDLCCKNYDMWVNRLDLATTPIQAALTGPGAFPNPDFLEVAKPGDGMSAVEGRSMFTMWAALPGPLMLSADLRPAAGLLTPEVLATLTNPEIIAVNQDPMARPMLQASKTADGLEVWHKPVSGGKTVVILFHRNATGCAACSVRQHGCCVAPPPTPPPPPVPTPEAGLAVTMGPCNVFAHTLKFAMPAPGKTGAIVLEDNRSLCLGSVGPAKCAAPAATGKVGIVDCSAEDPSQRWSGVDPVTGEIRSLLDPSHPHDLNAGPACAPDAFGSMLIYPVQGRPNEKYAYNAAHAAITNVGGTSCLMLPDSAPTPPPSPPPPLPPNRTISASWSELGWPATKAMRVRDLWSRKDLGTATGSFSASVQFHEAAMFILSPISDK